MKLWITLAITLLSSAATAAPSLLSGEKLLRLCEQEYSQNECLLYIAGVEEGVSWAAEWNNALAESASTGERYDMWCKPDRITGGQLYRIVVKDLQSHPERLHQNAGGLVIGALMRAFPCE